MLETLLVIYLGINILTWILIIPWILMYLKDKYYNHEDKTNETATTVIEPTATDNIHYSEYISGEDLMNIFSTLDSDKYKKPEEKFYYHGKYLTSDEVIEKAHEILRWSINY